ncbi:unnamed protein product [Calypogeia fissa]
MTYIPVNNCLGAGEKLRPDKSFALDLDESKQEVQQGKLKHNDFLSNKALKEIDKDQLGNIGHGTGIRVPS